MSNITLSVPVEIKALMEKYPEIKWSEIARKAIINKIHQLEVLEQITAKSTLTDKDIETLDKKIKHGMARHYKS